MDRPDLHENEGRRNARRNNIAAIALAAPRYAGSAAPQVPRPPPGRRRTTARAADRPAPARVLGRTAASPLSESGAFAVATPRQYPKPNGMSSRPRRRAPASRRHRRTQPRRHEPHPRRLDRIAPEYDVTPIARATDLSRIAIYIALRADRNPAFPTLSRIARARTEAPVHGVSPATAHMPRIVHTIRPRSHHRRSVPAAPLDKTANLLEHCRSNARRRETVNRTELCARIAARSTSTRADAATARRVGAAIPAPGKPSPSPPAPLRRSRPARPFAAGSTDSMASARFGGTRSAANRSPGGHAFRDPPAATRRPRFAAAFANSPAPSPQPIPRSLRDCDYLAAAVWVSIASGARDVCRRADGRYLCDSPNVRTCARTARGHWIPAVPPLLIEGDANCFR